MAKRPLILLSGGVDSTYLAQHAVSERTGFDRLYIKGGQGVYKIAAESAAVEAIVTQLNASLSDRIDSESRACRVCEPVFSFDNYNHKNFPSQGFFQAYSWFFGAMSAADPDRHSSVQIGYLSSDQIASAAHRLIEAWELLWPIFKQGDFVPLEFPLWNRYYTKQYVLGQIRLDLYKLTWVCERPVVKAQGDDKVYLECGRCDACVNRIIEAERYRLLNGRSLPDTIHEERKAALLAMGVDVYKSDVIQERSAHEVA